MKTKNTELKAIRKQELSKLKKFHFHPDTEKIIKNAAFEYKGQFNTLESAIGALYIGQLYGWRILRIVHGSKTYNNYEKILGGGKEFKFSYLCDDEGILARRSIGYRIAKSLNSFWKIATGKYKTNIDLKLADDGLD